MVGRNLSSRLHVDDASLGSVWISHWGSYVDGGLEVAGQTVSAYGKFVEIEHGVNRKSLPCKGDRWIVAAWVPLSCGSISKKTSHVLQRMGAADPRIGRLPAARRPGRAFGFLEVFSGVAVLTDVASQLGMRVFPPIDILHGGQCDILDPAVLGEVLRKIRSGEVQWVHLGTPCTSFCRFYVMFNKKCTRSSQ